MTKKRATIKNVRNTVKVKERNINKNEAVGIKTPFGNGII